MTKAPVDPFPQSFILGNSNCWPNVDQWRNDSYILNITQLLHKYPTLRPPTFNTMPSKSVSWCLMQYPELTARLRKLEKLMISTNTPFAKLRASLKRSIFGRCHVTRSSRLDKPFNHGGKMHGAKESFQFLCQERCLKQTSAISIPSTPYLRAYDTYYMYFITPIHALLSNSHKEFTEALLQFIFKVQQICH